jgi:hypothetical protein
MSPQAREHSLDELARGLASGGVTRGKAIRLIGAALLGGTLASFGIGGVAAADDECKPTGKKCKKDKQCCSGKCEGGTCAAACGSNGATCTEGTQCCSGNCKGDMCVESCIPPNAIPCDTGSAGACPPQPGCGGCVREHSTGVRYCASLRPTLGCTTSCDCPTGQFCSQFSSTGSTNGTFCAVAC